MIFLSAIFYTHAIFHTQCVDKLIAYLFINFHLAKPIAY